MDLRVNEDALGLGLLQVTVGLIGIVVLFALTWRTVRAVQRRIAENGEFAAPDILSLAWPPALWLLLLLIGALAFSTMQAYGPRVAIERTPLTVDMPSGKQEVRDLSPAKTTDEERLRQQRALEAETKARVELPDSPARN
ncbi:MAG: hypothetical protein RLZ98_2322 [Pseudomonadota bacterium]|jgi:hypothetical protein